MAFVPEFVEGILSEGGFSVALSCTRVSSEVLLDGFDDSGFGISGFESPGLENSSFEDSAVDSPFVVFFGWSSWLWWSFSINLSMLARLELRSMAVSFDVSCDSV